jgi:hypothetical protein
MPDYRQIQNKQIGFAELQIKQPHFSVFTFNHPSVKNIFLVIIDFSPLCPYLTATL